MTHGWASSCNENHHYFGHPARSRNGSARRADPATAQRANLDHRHDAVIPSRKSDQDVGQTTGSTGLEGSNPSPSVLNRLNPPRTRQAILRCGEPCSTVSECSSRTHRDNPYSVRTRTAGRIPAGLRQDRIITFLAVSVPTETYPWNGE